MGFGIMGRKGGSGMTRGEWISGQVRSFLHGAALAGFFLVLFAGLSGLVYGWGYYALFGAFFLVTSWPFLKVMILITAGLSLLVFLFPVLAPFMLLLMAVFFLLRIRFVVRHWQPLLMGVLVYGIGLSLGEWGWIVHIGNDPFERPYMGALMGAGFLTALLHRGLVWLYGKGYTTKAALGLMGSVPLFVLAFVLPFLKIAGAEGFFGEPVVFHDAPAGDGALIHGEPVTPHPAPQGLPDAVAPLHYVEPHVRMTGDGPVQVAGHFQTNPDGVLINNLGEQGFSLRDGHYAGPEPYGTAAASSDPAGGAVAEAADPVYPGDVKKNKKRDFRHGTDGPV